MKGVRRQLRRRSRTILVWLLILGALIYVKLEKYCSAPNSLSCQSIAWIVGGLATLVLCSLGIRYFRQKASSATYSQDGFALHPERYEKAIIQLWGRIEYVFPDTFSERVKRKIIDLYRSMLGDTDPNGRYLHQRFLMSSPLLLQQHRLLVFHNLSFGKEPIKKGRWVEVQGEYLHTPGVKKTAWGSDSTFYGRLHYTHTPKGFLRVSRSRAGIRNAISTVEIKTLPKEGIARNEVPG